MNQDEMKDFFTNPYYAINISPSLCESHEPMVTKDKWIKVNAKLIDDIGKEKWLERLLEVLETGAKG